MFIVYKLVWSPSGRFYFGHTNRTLDERVEEHRNGDNAAVRQAFREEGPPDTFPDSWYSTKAKALDREKTLIAANRSSPKCLNRT